MKLLNLSIFFIIVILSFSCDNSVKETTSGRYSYTVIKDKPGRTAELYEYILLTLKITDKNDSVWLLREFPFTAWGIEKRPMIKEFPQKGIDEIFYELSIGDSVTFDVSIGNFYTNTANLPVPPKLDTAESINFFARVDTIFSKDDFIAFNEQNKQKIIQKNRDRLTQLALEESAKIANVLKRKNIETITTSSGVHVFIREEGSGSKVDSLDILTVNYTGYLFADSTYFDTSNKQRAIDMGVYASGRTYGPMEFVVDKTQVIAGWHDGVKVLKKGSVATLIIPSPLGYGARWAGRGKIPPNSPLVFDIEILDIQKNDDK